MDTKTLIIDLLNTLGPRLFVFFVLALALIIVLIICAFLYLLLHRRFWLKWEKGKQGMSVIISFSDESKFLSEREHQRYVKEPSEKS